MGGGGGRVVGRWVGAAEELRGFLLPRRNRGAFVFALAGPCVLAGEGGAASHIRDLLLRICCQG